MRSPSKARPKPASNGSDAAKARYDELIKKYPEVKEIAAEQTELIELTAQIRGKPKP